MRAYEDILSALDLSIPKTASLNDLTFDDVANEGVKKELLLIQDVQKRNNFLAEQQLIAMYRGLLTKSVNKSPAISSAGYDAVYTRAVNALKTAIRNYTLQNYKVAQPATYFTTNIEGELKKLNNSSNLSASVKLPENIALYKKDVGMAQKTLRAQLGREPNAQEIFDYIKKEMKKGGQGLTLSSVQRVLHYDTKEYSGSRTISNENADGAEALTYGEVYGGSNVNTEDKYMKQLENDNVVKLVQGFTQNRDERRFLMQMLGVGGEFNGKPAKSLNEAVFNNNNMTYHLGKKLMDDFKKHATEKGLI